MRLFAIAAATLLAASAAPALAQPPGPPPHGRPGWHGGHHRWHGRRCTWVWRHHHRVRRCW